MMAVAFLALLANMGCLLLISKHRGGGAHMKASWIFSANDVVINVGVIVARRSSLEWINYRPDYRYCCGIHRSQRRSAYSALKS